MMIMVGVPQRNCRHAYHCEHHHDHAITITATATTAAMNTKNMLRMTTHDDYDDDDEMIGDDDVDVIDGDDEPCLQ